MRSLGGSVVHVDSTTESGLLGTTQFSRVGGQFIFADGSIVGTRPHTSPEYTPQAGKQTVHAHSLVGLNPDEAQAEVWLVCKVAEAGYAVGEKIRLFSTYGTGGTMPSPLVLTPTNIRTTTSTNIAVPDGTGVTTNLTLANWRYVFKIKY